MDKEKKNLLVFGYGLATIFVFISFRLWHNHGLNAMHALLFPCIIVLVFMTGMRYDLLRPFYRQWMKVAHFIGSVITGLVLSALFYLVFAPVGILLRLLRKDLLDRKADHAVNSYWIKKEQVDFDKNHYTRQF